MDVSMHLIGLFRISINSTIAHKKLVSCPLSPPQYHSRKRHWLSPTAKVRMNLSRSNLVRIKTQFNHLLMSTNGGTFENGATLAIEGNVIGLFAEPDRDQKAYKLPTHFFCSRSTISENSDAGVASPRLSNSYILLNCSCMHAALQWSGCGRAAVSIKIKTILYVVLWILLWIARNVFVIERHYQTPDVMQMTQILDFDVRASKPIIFEQRSLFVGKCEAIWSKIGRIGMG